MGLVHIHGNVYLLHGAGPNITVQIGDQVVTLVNAGPEGMSSKIREVIRTISDKPIGFIFNTSTDAENIGGNDALARGGFYMFAAPGAQRKIAAVVMFQRGLDRLQAANGPSDGQPSDTYATPEWHLYANGEPIILEHPVDAHSDADTVVFFRGSDVVSTGSIFDMTSYPVIDEKNGGSLSGILKEINHLLADVAITENNEEGGTYFIPQHGHATDRNDLTNYRDMLTIIQGRIQAGIKRHLTLEQVKAAKPTYDYDGAYGSTTGPWTTDMFINAVYQENSKKPKQEAGK